MRASVSDCFLHHTWVKRPYAGDVASSDFSKIGTDNHSQTNHHCSDATDEQVRDQR
ncbi:MAG: hypothetical protein BroJett021_07270 [Chloroflexota bacterium]|nr:MAG: hypothetical protein BroJett021_07270 [Chloroflexota bacterium]